MVSSALSVGQASANTWLSLDESEDYTARHEASFAQAGDRFYLFGGRENPQTVDTYNYTEDVWTRSASTPIPFNHFQATEHQGLIWVIGAFADNGYPNEAPAVNIYTFDPANDFWLKGREIPVERQRGAAGLVEYNEKFYLVGGNTIGHNGGYVSWFDEFDPQTGSWTALQDAPSPRDHFQATIANNKLYVTGGRLSGGEGGTFAPLIETVDVYDFANSSWSTLPSSGNLPTPRAGTSTVTFEGNVIVIGGEGNGQAYDTVEQLNPFTNLWTEIAPLNHARHGTQAIVSGNGIFTAVGSPRQGGGNQHNLEAFNSSQPIGEPNSAAQLSFVLDEILITSSEPVSIELVHEGGNQGALVTSVELDGDNADSFILTEQTSLPNLVPVDGAKTISVRADTDIDGEIATLVVSYDNGATATIPIRSIFESRATNLVDNGSFESVSLTRNYMFVSSFGAWQKNGNGKAEFWQNGFLGQPAQDGNVLSELDVNRSTVDSMSQDILTTAGKTYDLSFYLKARPNTSSDENELIVLWNDQPIANYVGGESWVQSTLQVVGSGYDRLTLSETSASNTGKGTHIDNISLIVNNDLPKVISNLSLGQPAEQSSNYSASAGAASLAVDGNTNGRWGGRSVTHTKRTFEPWWQVDLGSQSDIETIEIYNRTDNCCISRLSNFYVLISDQPFASDSLDDLLNDANVTQRFYTSLTSSSLNIDFDETVGRYVRIQLLNSGVVSLAEVEVMGSRID